MGTDISFYAEHRVDRVWRSADRWEDGRWGRRMASKPFFDNRDYRLFAILAGVRDPNREFPRISEPRGIPDDLSPEVRAEHGGGEWCSYSWLSLADIMAFDWTQLVRLRRLITVENYILWVACNRDRNVGPATPHFGVTDWHSRVIPTEEVEDFIAREAPGRMSPIQRAERIKAKFGEQAVVPCTWDVHCYYEATQFLAYTVPRLWRLGAPEDVRVVFWFDY